MAYKKICVLCGKIFYTKSYPNKYCSKSCRADASEKRRGKAGQPCFLCKKGCGGCPWSDRFEPVDGWVAIKTIIKDGIERDFASYDIKYCPLFEYGRRLD